MSTRCSLQFLSIGDYISGTECTWHLYEECFDRVIWLELIWRSRTIYESPIPRWASMLYSHSPAAYYRRLKWRYIGAKNWKAIREHRRRLEFIRMQNKDGA